MKLVLHSSFTTDRRKEDLNLRSEYIKFQRG